jgi:hypothetical protein
LPVLDAGGKNLARKSSKSSRKKARCEVLGLTLLHLAPNWEAVERLINEGTVVNAKAVTAVEKSDLPHELITELKNARKYAEGRGLRIDVKNSTDVEHIKKLVEIKVNN